MRGKLSFAVQKTVVCLSCSPAAFLHSRDLLTVEESALLNVVKRNNLTRPWRKMLSYCWRYGLCELETAYSGCSQGVGEITYEPYNLITDLSIFLFLLFLIFFVFSSWVPRKIEIKKDLTEMPKSIPISQKKTKHAKLPPVLAKK